MFLKILLLVAVIAAVWFGFRHLERRNRIAGGSRRPVERSFTERLKKSMRGKTGASSDPRDIEDTESCPTCKAYVSVTGISNCGKPNCPY